MNMYQKYEKEAYTNDPYVNLAIEVVRQAKRDSSHIDNYEEQCRGFGNKNPYTFGTLEYRHWAWNKYKYQVKYRWAKEAQDFLERIHNAIGDGNFWDMINAG